MPLYEFECLQCKKSFEELVRATSAMSEVVCPVCGSPNIHRKVSTFAAKVSSSGATAPAASCAPGG